MKYLIIGIAFAICSTITLPLSAKIVKDTLITVPLGGNAWRIDKDTTGGAISDDGIVDWSNKFATYAVYFRLGHTGKFKLYLDANVPQGKSKIAVTALGVTKELTLSLHNFTDIYIGEWTVTDTGYLAIRIKGSSKTNDLIAYIRSIKLEGTAIDNKTTYVKNNEGHFFYWGRRGPSVHLGYTLPEGVNAEWFYNEVTVPKGNDALGSYFMACGFGEGYFGMQVNGPGERRLLFSVWSPFNTDDPNAIPADQKINLLKKGDRVHNGEFGNEGAGGQSFMNYL